MIREFSPTMVEEQIKIFALDSLKRPYMTFFYLLSFCLFYLFKTPHFHLVPEDFSKKGILFSGGIKWEHWPEMG